MLLVNAELVSYKNALTAYITIFFFTSKLNSIINLDYFHPRVTGIGEAISRVKNSQTGEWGSSLEFERDFELEESTYSKLSEKTYE